MKAWAHRTPGGVNVLEVVEMPKPVATGRDILVKVVAVATNPVDGKARKGFGPQGAPGQVQYDPPKILGWDCAGIVESVGETATMFKPGDEVYFAGSIVRQGCNAEFCLVDERIVALRPKTLTWEQSAAMPLCTLTAWEGLIEGAGIPIPSESNPNPNGNKTILILGGAGGVGSVCIQLAKAYLKFGTVIATASRPITSNWCKGLGADHVINHEVPLYPQIVDDLGFTKGIHYIYVTPDLNKVLKQVLSITRVCGKIIGITGFSGLTDLEQLQSKRISLIGELMFARARDDEEPELQHQILATTAKLLDSGVLRHVKNEQLHFDWKELPKAQSLQDSGKAYGKITLTVKF